MRTWSFQDALLFVWSVGRVCDFGVEDGFERKRRLARSVVAFRSGYLLSTGNVGGLRCSGDLGSEV